MAQSKLNKQLFTDITRLKLCNKPDAPVRFILDQSPFNEDEEQEETATASNSKDIVIIGRIFPNSDIFREGAYQIEIKLIPSYPSDPPEVRFITPIYHPNVSTDGTFCHDLLKKSARWVRTLSLVDVVRAVVKHIDEPEIDYALSLELGREYMENKSVFNRKCLEYVRKHALPRY